MNGQNRTEVHQTARRASIVCLAGATFQIFYGLLAVVFPYPAVTAIGFELTWEQWVPLVVLGTGLVAAAFYSVDRVGHFILLGLLWGPAWLLLGWTELRRSGSARDQLRSDRDP